MGVADVACAVHQEYRWSAEGEQLLELHVLPSHPAALIGQDGIRGMIFKHVFFNHFWPVRYHHQDCGIQVSEPLIIAAQLRHMVGAMQSDESNIEHQQYVMGGVEIGQSYHSAPIIGQ
jgi:hypothetical protein